MRVVESMSEVLTNLGRVRIWRTVKEFGDLVSEDLGRDLAETVWRTRAEVVGRIEREADVAAYEVVDGAGNGWVVYPDWQ